MTIDEFRNNIESLFPVKRKDIDFRMDLKSVLNNYARLIDALDGEIKDKYDNWNASRTRIEKLISGIINCVDAYYESAHHSAYIILYNQINGVQTISGILTSIKLYTIKIGEYLWRGRVFEKNRGKTHKDMFHIPFENRGIVKTQRYSAPGYPCLYLGTTIYSCWEELGRPKFDDLMVSGFKAVKNMKLLNLCRPKADEYGEENLMNLLLRLPLILACSFVVQEKDEKADFKPEYIIPQMLLEVIININNRERRQKHPKKIEELTLGIIYTSTKINNDFYRSAELFENIAIPAIDVSNSKGHCRELADCFLVTSPTCNEYEELKKLPNNSVYHRDVLANPAGQYEFSKMGRLESTIKRLDPQKIEYVSSREIQIPNDGAATSVQVRSNVEFKIE
ncbi:MAG: hypothetical protein NC226_07065 [Bacteroides cellulosilyticus]|nr:hypothetical protein [Bacteroides cellulosilyticus]